MIELIAVCQIVRNPTGRCESTGDYDALGEPIMRGIPDIHLPGESFECEDEDEAAQLLQSGAARLPGDENFPPMPTESASVRDLIGG